MKILVIQLAKMGDIIQSRGIINKLRFSYPQAEIYLLHSDIVLDVNLFVNVHEHIPVNLDKIIEKEGKSFTIRDNLDVKELYLKLNYYDFDLVINLNSTLVAEQILSNIKCSDKIGFGSNDYNSNQWLMFCLSFIKTRRLMNINLVDIYRHVINPLAEDNFVESIENQILEVEPDINLKDKKILFQLGSRNHKRQLPVDSFVKLAKLCRESEAEIHLIGSRGERKKANVFLSQFKFSSEIINHVGQTTLPDLIEIIGNADAIITGDTGPMHIAGMLNTKIVAFFDGPAFPNETLAYTGNIRAITPDYGRFHCYPCPDDDPCLYKYACQRYILPEDLYELLKGNKTQTNYCFKTSYDKIGQLLLPVQKIPLAEDFFMADIYRNFALQYFFDYEEPNHIVRESFIIEDTNVDYLINQLKRELKIAEKLFQRLRRPDFNIPQLPMTQPLLYIRKILGDNDLFGSMFDYLRKI